MTKSTKRPAVARKTPAKKLPAVKSATKKVPPKPPARLAKKAPAKKAPARPAPVRADLAFGAVEVDLFDPTTHDARDASHFRAIIQAKQRLEQAELDLRNVVAAAREAGESWVIIGAAMGTTRQGAYQRFGRD